MGEAVTARQWALILGALVAAGGRPGTQTLKIEPGSISSVAVLHADSTYKVTGMVVQVDRTTKTMVVAHETIRGFMEAMTMPFEVRDARELDRLEPGAAVEFTLVVTAKTSYVQGVTVRRYRALEQDPRAARRLAIVRDATRSAPSAPVLKVGDSVPAFALTNQQGRRVALHDYTGKVVALNFVYTRCALPQFCLRIANHFGALQRRLRDRLGRDLVLMTVTFDPARDTPDVLAKYAAQWDADPRNWHFLTGDVAEVRRLTARFGVDSFPDEGVFNHSLRTVVLDRQGRIAASIEGNEYTTEQLEALVRAQIGRS